MATGAALSSQQLDERCAELRALAQARAWERPAGDNVRERLASLSGYAGVESRLVELRQEVADRLLADAVALRYADRPDVAANRVRFALELVPDLLGARDFLAELDARAGGARSGRPSGPGSAPEQAPFGPLLPRPTSVPPPQPGAAPAVPADINVFEDR